MRASLLAADLAPDTVAAAVRPVAVNRSAPVGVPGAAWAGATTPAAASSRAARPPTRTRDVVRPDMPASGFDEQELPDRRAVDDPSKG